VSAGKQLALPAAHKGSGTSLRHPRLFQITAPGETDAKERISPAPSKGSRQMAPSAVAVARRHAALRKWPPPYAGRHHLPAADRTRQIPYPPGPTEGQNQTSINPSLPSGAAQRGEFRNAQVALADANMPPWQHDICL
jgi:hypothetical protein